MPSKLPRLIDMIGPDKPKPAKALPMSRRRRAALTLDAKSMPTSCFGEPMPLDRSAIVYTSAARASDGLAADAALGPIVQGETYPIAD